MNQLKYSEYNNSEWIVLGEMMTEFKQRAVGFGSKIGTECTELWYGATPGLTGRAVKYTHTSDTVAGKYVYGYRTQNKRKKSLIKTYG